MYVYGSTHTHTRVFSSDAGWRLILRALSPRPHSEALQTLPGNPSRNPFSQRERDKERERILLFRFPLYNDTSLLRSRIVLSSSAVILRTHPSSSAHSLTWPKAKTPPPRPWRSPPRSPTPPPSIDSRIRPSSPPSPSPADERPARCSPSPRRHWPRCRQCPPAADPPPDSTIRAGWCARVPWIASPRPTPRSVRGGGRNRGIRDGGAPGSAVPAAAAAVVVVVHCRRNPRPARFQRRRRRRPDRMRRWRWRRSRFRREPRRPRIPPRTRRRVERTRPPPRRRRRRSCPSSVRRTRGAVRRPPRLSLLWRSRSPPSIDSG
mmetsp:Transcript_18754/g.54157  ORF Transcript_18754/g.54157 Transcript_18754/m.54157 type:complete len:320 (-) Transcript_18754:295-1254(-)